MNKKQYLTFGSRGSDLARRQTEIVAERLQEVFADLTIQTTIFSTKGDKKLDKPLPEIGGKGLFTAELEAALLDDTIDLAVHSLKDLPIEDTPGLTIGAIPSREDPADALISRRGYTLDTLPRNAVVGTSSLRRAAQFLACRPDLEILPLRGNVDTRLRKAMDPDGPYDVIILAVAGLSRMGLTEHISQRLPFEVMLPAPGQGAIAVQCRADDKTTMSKVACLNHPHTQQAVLAERTFLAELGGGCSLPVGVLGQVDEDTLTLQGVIVSLDGKRVIRVTQQGAATEAQPIGQELAQQALAQGAHTLLEAVHA
jgi:hydroxymethylbilane synthase